MLNCIKIAFLIMMLIDLGHYGLLLINYGKTTSISVEAQPDTYKDVISVAKVLGRVPGCAKANDAFIQLVAKTAQDHGLNPALLASLIAVESNCDTYAISNQGAVGLTQVRPSVWKDKFNFSGTDNLFNPAINLRIGATILKELIQKNGIEKGIQLYNGNNKDGNRDYAKKIIKLAGL